MVIPLKKSFSSPLAEVIFFIPARHAYVLAVKNARDVDISGFHDTAQDVSRKKTIAQVVDIYLLAMDVETGTGAGAVWKGRSASPRDVKERRKLSARR